jgi:hypothetical protein
MPPELAAAGQKVVVSHVDFTQQSIYAKSKGIFFTKPDTQAVIKIRRRGPLENACVVKIYTGSGTAIEGTHFQPKSTYIEFQPAKKGVKEQILEFVVTIDEDNKVHEAARMNNPLHFDVHLQHQKGNAPKNLLQSRCIVVLGVSNHQRRAMQILKSAFFRVSLVLSDVFCCVVCDICDIYVGANSLWIQDSVVSYCCAIYLAEFIVCTVLWGDKFLYSTKSMIGIFVIMALTMSLPVITTRIGFGNERYSRVINVVVRVGRAARLPQLLVHVTEAVLLLYSMLAAVVDSDLVKEVKHASGCSLNSLNSLNPCASKKKKSATTPTADTITPKVQRAEEGKEEGKEEEEENKEENEEEAAVLISHEVENDQHAKHGLDPHRLHSNRALARDKIRNKMRPQQRAASETLLQALTNVEGQRQGGKFRAPSHAKKQDSLLLGTKLGGKNARSKGVVQSAVPEHTIDVDAKLPEMEPVNSFPTETHYGVEQSANTRHTNPRLSLLRGPKGTPTVAKVKTLNSSPHASFVGHLKTNAFSAPPPRVTKVAQILKASKKKNPKVGNLWRKAARNTTNSLNFAHPASKMAGFEKLDTNKHSAEDLSAYGNGAEVFGQSARSTKMIEFISNKIIFMLLMVVMIANALNVIDEPIPTQKQYALESLEITLSLQDFAHACLWGAACDTCRGSCEVNETVATATNYEAYYPQNPLLNVTMQNTQFPSSFDMLLDMFIDSNGAGNRIGSRFNPEQELIFLKIGGRAYNKQLQLDTARLPSLRLAEVYAAHSSKFSYEFYRQNLRSHLSGASGHGDSLSWKEKKDLDSKEIVTDLGCDFSGVRDTGMLHHEVMSKRCATVVIFDASRAFHATAINNLFVTLCILLVILIGGTLIYADLRVLFEPLEQLTEVATLCSSWLQQKREELEQSAAKTEARTAAIKAAAVARTAAKEISAHPEINLEVAPSMVFAASEDKSVAFAVSTVEGEEGKPKLLPEIAVRLSLDGEDQGPHTLAKKLFEMVEESQHGLEIGTATLLLLCESLQDLTGVPLSHPQQQLLQLKEGASTMMHIAQSSLDHVVHETLTWSFSKQLIATTCELIFPPAQCREILKDLKPFSRHMESLTGVLGESMKTLGMEDELRMSNGREGIHLPKIDQYIDKVGSNIERLIAMCVMAEIQFEMSNALRCGLNEDVHQVDHVGTAVASPEDCAVRRIQNRWRTRQELRRWRKLWRSPLSRSVTKLRALLLPLHYQAIDSLHLGPAFAMLSGEQKQRLYSLVLTSKEPSQVKNMAEVRDYVWTIFEQFFHHLLASALSAPDLSSNPAATAALRSALHKSDNNSPADAQKWMQALTMVQKLVPLIGPNGIPTSTAGMVLQQVLKRQGVDTSKIAKALEHAEHAGDSLGDAEEAAMDVVMAGLSSATGLDDSVMQGVRTAYIECLKGTPSAATKAESAHTQLPSDVLRILLAADRVTFKTWVEEVGEDRVKVLLFDRCADYDIDYTKLMDGDEETLQFFVEAVLESKLHVHGVAKGVLSGQALNAFKAAVADAPIGVVKGRTLATSAGSAINTAVDNVFTAVGGLEGTGGAGIPKIQALSETIG